MYARSLAVRKAAFDHGSIRGNWPLACIPLSKIAHRANATELLLEQCQRVLGKDEMVQHGATWRWRATSNSSKLQRVIADLRVMQRQGIAVRAPGAYAERLWQMFQ